MSDQDPPRLGAAGSPELRSLLSAGRSETPDAAQLTALAAKVAAIGVIGGGGGGGGAAAGGAAAVKTAAKIGLATKIVGAVAIVGATGTAVVVARQAEKPVQTPIGLVATATATASASATASATATASASATASATASASASAPASATASASASAPAPVVRPLPSSDASPEAEVKLLERAQDALRSRPAEALALCNDHAKRFPQGMLVQEREVIAIEALVKTGHKDEAKARAARFSARFPGSSHTRRLETLVAD